MNEMDEAYTIVYSARDEGFLFNCPKSIVAPYSITGKESKEWFESYEQAVLQHIKINNCPRCQHKHTEACIEFFSEKARSR